MFDIYHKAKRIIELRQQATAIEMERKEHERTIREYLQKEGAHKATIHDVNVMIERETTRRINLTDAKRVLSPEMVDTLCKVSEYERVKVW